MTNTFDSEFSTGAKGYAYVPVNPKTGQPNATYTPLGQMHGGKVMDIRTGIHMNDYTTGLPAYWDPETKQRPKKQSVIVVDTRAGKCPAPPIDQTDDGYRSIFVREGSELNKEIAKALREAPGLTVGSQLYVIWTGERPNTKGGNPAKTFTVKHIPPAAQPVDQFFGTQSAAGAAPADQFAALSQQPAAPAWVPPVYVAGSAPVASAGPAPAGVDPATYAAFLASQQATPVQQPAAGAINPATGQPFGVPGPPASAPQAPYNPSVPYNPQIGNQQSAAGSGAVDPFAGLS